MSIDVNAPDIISLSEVYISFPVYHLDGDNEGDETGERERVQVTHIREEPDSDIALYYIARVVRVASGKEIPETELSELRHIDYMGNCNAPTLSDSDAKYLDECISDRVMR